MTRECSAAIECSLAKGQRLGKELEHVESRSLDGGRCLDVESADRQRNPGPPQMNAALKKTRDHGRQTVCQTLGGKEPNSVPSHIVFSLISQVNSWRQPGQPPQGQFQMAGNRKSRRQQHGSAWHWKQTDCWYFTPPWKKKRDALFDENEERIRGKDNKEAAQLALARIKLTDELTPTVRWCCRFWSKH